MKALDDFYENKEEPIKSCLLALREIILNYHIDIKPKWYYRLPCFMFKNQIFCYLWVDKKSQFPYIAIGKGIKIEHPDLVKGKRTFTKLLFIDPNKDIDVEKIYSIFNVAMSLYN
jgi:hypothetical protein